MTYETHVIDFIVVFDFPIGRVCAWEGVEELELYDGRGIERSAVFASVPDDAIGQDGEQWELGLTCAQDRLFGAL
jgi:hypothetical protein